MASVIFSSVSLTSVQFVCVALTPAGVTAVVAAFVAFDSLTAAETDAIGVVVVALTSVAFEGNGNVSAVTGTTLCEAVVIDEVVSFVVDTFGDEELIAVLFLASYLVVLVAPGTGGAVTVRLAEVLA